MPLVVFAVAVLACTSAAISFPAKRGSGELCGTVGPHVIAADAQLAPAAQMAVALGTDDTEVLSGTHAHHGSAYKLVEDDSKVMPNFFHVGMDEVTQGQIAANMLTDPQESSFANNTLDSYSNALNAVEAFEKFTLLYERSVNSKNRRSRMVAMSEAFAALGDYSSSTTTMNASCFGGSCYGSARTTSYASNSGAANMQAAAIGAAGVAQSEYSLDQATPYMMDLTQKIDNYQYGYRRLRAVWLSACPNLGFLDHWTGATSGAN